MEGVSILPHLGVEQEQYRENLKPSDQHEEGKNGQGWTRYDLDLWDLYKSCAGRRAQVSCSERARSSVG